MTGDVLNLFDEDSEPYGPKPPKPYGEVDRRPTAKGSMAGGEIVENVHRFPHVIGRPHEGGAPPLDWWVIATTKDEAYRRVITAMVPEKVCRECGEPSRRIVGGVSYVNNAGRPARMDMNQPRYAPGVRQFEGYGDNAAHRIAETLGFSDCGHNNWRPGVWLDPFNPEAT